MFIPVPVLVISGLIFLLMILQIIRSNRTRDPLLGDKAPAFRLVPASYPAEASTRAIATLPPETELQVRALIIAGRKIEAIKLTRNVTHLGLKESKDLVETLQHSPVQK